MTDPNLVTTVEAAELLGRSVRTVQHWAATGRLTPALKAPGVNGAQFFARSAVEALAASERDQSAALTGALDTGWKAAAM